MLKAAFEAHGLRIKVMRPVAGGGIGGGLIAGKVGAQLSRMPSGGASTRRKLELGNSLVG